MTGATHVRCTISYLPSWFDKRNPWGNNDKFCFIIDNPRRARRVRSSSTKMPHHHGIRLRRPAFSKTGLALQGVISFMIWGRKLACPVVVATGAWHHLLWQVSNESLNTSSLLNSLVSRISIAVAAVTVIITAIPRSTRNTLWIGMYLQRTEMLSSFPYSSRASHIREVE